MTGAPTTSPTLPICAVRFVGSARPRQKLLPRMSWAGTAAPQTISRVTRTAHAASRSPRGARSDRDERAGVEAATGAHGTVAAAMAWKGRRLHLVGIGGGGGGGYAPGFGPPRGAGRGPGPRPPPGAPAPGGPGGRA